MSSTWGSALRLSLFGQSHGPAVGMSLDGFPAGWRIDMDALLGEMARRTPGQGPLTTPRRESDAPEFLSGVLDGVTTGQPLCAIVRSSGQRSSDYGDGVDLVRPGHADYTGHVRYFGFEDWRGGGSFSGRLTAPIVLAGALCRQWLAAQGVVISAHVSRLARLSDDPIGSFAGDTAFLRGMRLPVLRKGLDREMEARILAAREAGDSVGGAVTCRIDGLPAGLGSPFFDSAESVLSHLFFSVPGVKAVAFGDGEAFADLRGSEANDPFRMDGDRIVTASNHAGGINGGITNGMPLLVTCTLRPTPSIARPQETVSLKKRCDAELTLRGRHDPCIVPRAVPVLEAMAALGILDLWKERAACVR